MKRGTDFNDLHQVEGPDAVRACIEGAQEPDGEPQAGAHWPVPQPVTAKIDPRPYPFDALPGIIGAAVAEVQGFAQAPAALVAGCALSAVSVALQALYDIERAPGLSGPISLYPLIIADSGERKSTCDKHFTQAIRAYEDAQREAAKPGERDYKAALAAWEAKYAGIKERIRQLAKEGKATREHEAALRELEDEKPEAPRVPRLLYSDVTPEALAFELATKWPAGAILSDEGGAVLGSHGMGNDSMMRNFALLNQLWEGATKSITRRTSESFTVKGARLTVALQVQESTLRRFFDQSKGLARGTGFLARFLVAWPESTQGYRPFKDAPTWERLAAFNRRMTDILNQPAPICEDGSLKPATLTLAPAAGDAWRAFHDRIEGQLRAGGDLFDVRDVASKIADNAARLAGLFHAFEGGSGPVSLDAFDRAARIAEWHLHESRRFFGELALPAELANAARLDTWLIDYCRRTGTHFVPMSEIQKSGPNGLRIKAAIEAAIVDLAELDRAVIDRSGRAKFIKVNPALLSPAAAVPAVTAVPFLSDADRTARTATTATAMHAKPEREVIEL
jgi:putative DNA primase/helicase